MAIAAQDSTFSYRGGADVRAGAKASFAPAVIGALFLVIVFLLFAVSSGMLGTLGINHGGVTGAVASKIHPATYLAFFTLALLMVARRNPASFFSAAITRQPGTLTFLLASLMLAAYIVMDG